MGLHVAAEPQRLTPPLYVRPRATYPILGALYHPPGGIIRHDAVDWGFARSADAAALGSTPPSRSAERVRHGDRAAAVRTNRGMVEAGSVISCTAGRSSTVAAMASVGRPITTHILQSTSDGRRGTRVSELRSPQPAADQWGTFGSLLHVTQGRIEIEVIAAD